MKKLFLVFILIVFTVPLYAYHIELPGEDNSLHFYGNVRLSAWYQNTNLNGKGLGGTKDGNDLIYKIQPNSRIGLDLKIGRFFAKAETNFSGDGSDADGKFGFRHLYGAYDFGSAGRLLIGRTYTLAETSLFYSSLWNTDGGISGYGSLYANRKPQIRYSVAGLDIALIAMDAYYSKNFNFGKVTAGKKNTDVADKWIPMVELAYNIRASIVTGKAFVSYAGIDVAANGDYTDAAGVTYNLGTQREFMNTVTAGFALKIKINKLTLIPSAFYSLNGGLVDKIRKPIAGGADFLKPMALDITRRDGKDIWNGIADMSTFGVGFAINYVFNHIVGMEVGGGYSSTTGSELRTAANKVGTVESYSAYFSVPIYPIGKWLLVAPTVGYFGGKTNVTQYIGTMGELGNFVAGIYTKIGF